jgi:hypothetical protein
MPDLVVAVRDLLQSLIDLRQVIRSIREMPEQDLITRGMCQLRSWRHQFEAGLPSWLSALKESMPHVVSARSQHRLPTVGRVSSAAEWLLTAAELAKETLAETDHCFPLEPADSCPRSLSQLSLPAWVELVAHRLGGRITDELGMMEPELRRELELVKAVAEEQPPDKPPAPITRQEAAERLERLRTQGEAFTSQHKLAEQIGCSSATINKAIKGHLRYSLGRSGKPRARLKRRASLM